METEQQPKVKNKGGRPLGTLNRMTAEARRRAQETGQLPHEFLLSVARGELIECRRIDAESGEITKYYETADFDRRVDAAKAAAPYYAPKISTVEVITGMTDAQLDEIIAGAAAEAALGTGDDGEGETDTDQEPVRSRVRR